MNIRECCFKTIPDSGRKLVWEVTYQCGYNCDYCFQTQKRNNSAIRMLGNADLLKICESLPLLKTEDVLVTGGEILFIEDALSIICKKMVEMQLSFSFSTASLFNLPFLKRLIQFNPRAINVSFDPCVELKDDSHKKEFEAIKQLLCLAQHHDIQVKITGVIYKSNVSKYADYLLEINELLSAYHSLNAVYITNPYDVGYIKQNVRINKTKQKDVIMQMASFEDERIRLINFPLHNNCLQKCPAGKIVNIDPIGNVYPCHLLANVTNDDYFKMGNMIHDETPNIVHRLDDFSKQIEDAVVECKENSGKCKRCNGKKICGGGCIAENISAGNMLELRLFCKKIPYPKKAIHRIATTFTHNVALFKDDSHDITQEEDLNIKNYVFNNLSKKQHDLAHSFDHTLAVVSIARYIAKSEKADLRVVTIAAYFHDYSPRRKLLYKSHTIESAEQATSYLRKNKYDEYEIERVYECIDRCTYGALLPETIEAKCVHDADLLDAIGARGIARVFAFGAAHKCETLGIIEWDIDNPSREVMSQVGPDPSPIYHFFSKLLWVKDRILTRIGKQMAEKRHRFLIDFLKNYQEETKIWAGGHRTSLPQKDSAFTSEHKK
jgi:uncharacterized protein